MNPSHELYATLKENRLIALLSPATPDACVAAFELLQPLGVVLEIALRTDAALAGIAAVRARHPRAQLLAGTVMTAEQARDAIDAGVAGIVSADYVPDVVAACVQADVMCIPGGLADAGKQLSQKAALYGCDFPTLRQRYPYQWIYKLFPAMAGGNNLELAAAWKAVYPELTIVYTGGVTAGNLESILDADPDAIVCASALTREIAEAARARAAIERWQAILRTATQADTTEEKSRPFKLDAERTGAVVTFGEIMLRLAAPAGERLSRATSLSPCYGGAEANVAVSLANFGWRSRFVSAVPDQALGDGALAHLRSFGVDTSFVQRSGSRLGLYFLEIGAAQRPSRVLYDRRASAITELADGGIDWEEVFKDARWFHWSGITPALSENTAAVLREAQRIARRMGIGISVDINYRARLWTADQARTVLSPLIEGADLLLGNEADFADVFGIRAGRSDPRAGVVDPAAYEDVAAQIIARFRVHRVAATLRESLSATDNLWSAGLHDGQVFHLSRRYPIHIVDRVGSGDAFAAGLIHGILLQMSSREALAFATAAGCLKHGYLGDANQAGAAEVAALAGGDLSGRVKR